MSSPREGCYSYTPWRSHDLQFCHRLKVRSPGRASAGAACGEQGSVQRACRQRSRDAEGSAVHCCCPLLTAGQSMHRCVMCCGGFERARAQQLRAQLRIRTCRQQPLPLPVPLVGSSVWPGKEDQWMDYLASADAPLHITALVLPGTLWTNWISWNEGAKPTHHHQCDRQRRAAQRPSAHVGRPWTACLACPLLHGSSPINGAAQEAHQACVGGGALPSGELHCAAGAALPSGEPQALLGDFERAAGRPPEDEEALLKHLPALSPQPLVLASIPCRNTM